MQLLGISVYPGMNPVDEWSIEEVNRRYSEAFEDLGDDVVIVHTTHTSCANYQVASYEELMLLIALSVKNVYGVPATTWSVIGASIELTEMPVANA